jgi:hypothetical protein
MKCLASGPFNFRVMPVPLFSANAISACIDKRTHGGFLTGILFRSRCSFNCVRHSLRLLHPQRYFRITPPITQRRQVKFPSRVGRPAAWVHRMVLQFVHFAKIQIPFGHGPLRNLKGLSISIAWNPFERIFHRVVFVLPDQIDSVGRPFR